MKNKMFCFQCQETAFGKGCTNNMGVCGKKSDTACLQDLLIYVVKGVAIYSNILRNKNKDEEILKKEVYRYIVNSLFITITNANFDNEDIIMEIKKGIELRENLKSKCSTDEIKKTEIFPSEIRNIIFNDKNEILNYATTNEDIEILSTKNEDIRSLREIIMYGLKGMAAYTEHAFNLNFTQDDIIEFIEKALLATLDNNLSVEKLLNLVLECGKFGIEAMALLDKANTTTFGNPEITKIKIGAGNRPGILISGHDLNDLKNLLEQSENSGVDIYTHSEMLPGHFYPELKKYKHFYGNYGNAWWDQKKDFANFNGPIIFTTNCIVPPSNNSSYNDKVFTTNASGYPGWKKIKISKDGKKDFSEVIELAKNCKPPVEIENGEIIGGFAHNQVISLADKIIENIKSGAIKKFVVMSGCDGRFKERSYYTEFAKKLPQDVIILTSGCAKYRYIKLNLGDINGIPRVLDAGQCNDSYSWAVIALKLKEIFNLNNINELPIVFNIAWYEQKAVIVLLALLYLGIKNIHLGPSLPGFLSENVKNILVEKFGIAAIENVEKDIEKLFLN